jgi:hypothetical protein
MANDGMSLIFANRRAGFVMSNELDKFLQAQSGYRRLKEVENLSFIPALVRRQGGKERVLDILRSVFLHAPPWLDKDSLQWSDRFR